MYDLSTRSGASTPKVLSYHHQAVGRLGANLKVIATSMDGKIVEAMQHSIYQNVIGLQFHPEPSSLYKPETKMTTVPGSPFSPNELLIQSNSIKFHQQFWKDFSQKVNEVKR